MRGAPSGHNPLVPVDNSPYNSGMSDMRFMNDYHSSMQRDLQGQYVCLTCQYGSNTEHEAMEHQHQMHTPNTPQDAREQREKRATGDEDAGSSLPKKIKMTRGEAHKKGRKGEALVPLEIENLPEPDKFQWNDRQLRLLQHAFHERYEDYVPKEHRLQELLDKIQPLTHEGKKIPTLQNVEV